MSCWGSEGGCQSLRTLFFNWKKRVEKKRAVARPAAEKNSRSYQRKYRSGIQVQTPASRPPSKFTCQYQKISRVATATTEITSSANVAAPLILYKGLDSDIRPAGSQGGLSTKIGTDSILYSCMYPSPRSSRAGFIWPDSNQVGNYARARESTSRFVQTWRRRDN